MCTFAICVLLLFFAFRNAKRRNDTVCVCVLGRVSVFCRTVCDRARTQWDKYSKRTAISQRIHTPRHTRTHTPTEQESKRDTQTHICRCMKMTLSHGARTKAHRVTLTNTRHSQFTLRVYRRFRLKHKMQNEHTLVALVFVLAVSACRCCFFFSLNFKRRCRRCRQRLLYFFHLNRFTHGKYL